MQGVGWRIGFTLAALAVLALLGQNTSCSSSHRLVEQVLGQTPEAQIVSYLAAIAEGDRQRALALWPEAGTPGAALAARRVSITNELLAYGPRLKHRILDVVWWRTCCEPGVIDDPGEAGAARIRVSVSSGNQLAAVYVFDLLVPGGYWGAAAGYPVRRWDIVDIYPEGADPLAWTLK
jgi:hypothetical protein